MRILCLISLLPFETSATKYWITYNTLPNAILKIYILQQFGQDQEAVHKDDERRLLNVWFAIIG